MTTLNIPDLVGASQVEIIEILVQNGDSVTVDQPLLVLETDKATMEIPAEQAGSIQRLLVKVGDKVSSGDAFAEMTAAASAAASPAPVTDAPVVSAAAKPTAAAAAHSAPAGGETTVVVPDLGGGAAIPVIEVLVKPGDVVTAEQSVLVLESDKATMEIPAGLAGTVGRVMVSVGDNVSTGDAMLLLHAQSGAVTAVSPAPAAVPAAIPAVAAVSPVASPSSSAVQAPVAVVAAGGHSEVHAGPAVRKLARELGVDLSQVRGSGRRGRLQKEDVQAFVKQRLQSAPQLAGSGIPKVPDIDFSQFGPVRREALNNVKRATARAMTTAWLNVPQVTQFDQADITSLEQYRIEQNQRFAQQGLKFSLVPFVLKAVARCLRDFPAFNASISADGETLILKDYVHIGVAVDTPKGLLVPVLRDVDTKSVTQITQELQEKARRAREGKLTLSDMQGGCFSLSSLGGIGGTAFTPIVNPPEVAILGLSKASMQPVWDGQTFVPRLLLPLSLSYDHRVIDGAEAARFSQKLAACLQDLRDVLM